MGLHHAIGHGLCSRLFQVQLQHILEVSQKCKTAPLWKRMMLSIFQGWYVTTMTIKTGRIWALTLCTLAVNYESRFHFKSETMHKMQLYCKYAFCIRPAVQLIFIFSLLCMPIFETQFGWTRELFSLNAHNTTLVFFSSCNPCLKGWSHCAGCPSWKCFWCETVQSRFHTAPCRTAAVSQKLLVWSLRGPD